MAPTNTNLGVKALMHSAVVALSERLDALEPWVFDDGWGVRDGTLRRAEGTLPYVACGARRSRRVHRPESFAHMRLSGAARRLNARAPANPGLDALASSAAVLDASAGDSFTDIYGPKRLRNILAPKHMALRLRRPLVLLPQTYGPFTEASSREAAAKVVRRARLAWARDAESYALLQELAGPRMAPGRLRQGVDMAFLLEPHAPEAPLPPKLAGWLSERAEDRTRPLVGVNLSGLLWNDPERAAGFGLSFDYRVVTRRLIERLLTESDADLVLVDHVLAASEDTAYIEADRVASAEVLAGLDPVQRTRVVHLPNTYSANETKWVVSQLDWFCGTRMHATIGALSSGVPAAAIGYSMKTRAVFETCGLADEVTDVAGMDDGDIVEQLWGSWLRRRAAQATLAATLPGVLAAAGEQMDEIARLVTAEQARLRQPA